jgi:hypothetical protein
MDILIDLRLPVPMRKRPAPRYGPELARDLHFRRRVGLRPEKNAERFAKLRLELF